MSDAPRYDEATTARFWAKVEKTDFCWLWRASAKPGGAGFFRAGGKNRIASRFAWELHCGPIPPGMVVCHRCDMPTCVNPTHLFLGTQADNLKDMTAKKRRARGEKFSNSKLTASEALAIRDGARSGQKIRPLARRFGIDPNTVRKIRDGKAWSHLP
jgi:hypothetical protein